MEIWVASHSQSLKDQSISELVESRGILILKIENNISFLYRPGLGWSCFPGGVNLLQSCRDKKQLTQVEVRELICHLFTNG